MNIEDQELASPSDLMAPDEALRMVLEVALPLAPRRISLPCARGLRLAESVVADRDYPPFHRAMMDGYAVLLASDGDKNTVRVVGQVAAGQAGARQLEPGECVEIMTGAECPPGTQAVIPFEQSIRDGEFMRLPVGIQSRQHMALRGSECRAQSVLLQVGDLVTPLAVGVLASVGRREVLVVPRPTLGIITTGGELVSAPNVPDWLKSAIPMAPCSRRWRRPGGFLQLACYTLTTTTTPSWRRLPPCRIVMLWY